MDPETMTDEEIGREIERLLNVLINRNKLDSISCDKSAGGFGWSVRDGECSAWWQTLNGALGDMTRQVVRRIESERQERERQEDTRAALLLLGWV